MYLPVIADANFENHFRNLKQVFLSITNECNLHCTHCLYKPWLKEEEEMPQNIAVSLIKKFKEMGALKLSLLGGEPTIYGKNNKTNSLLGIVDIAHSLGYEYIRMATNGLFGGDILDDQRFHIFDEISFSLDGNKPEMHDLFRKKGAFKNAIYNMEHCLRKNINVDITICIHKQMLSASTDNSVSAIIEFIVWAESIGISRINFHPIIEMGIHRDKWIGDSSIGPFQWVQLYSKLNEEIHSKHIKTPIRLPMRYVNDEIFNFNKAYYGFCPVKLGERVEVHPNGIIQVCALMKGTDVSIANYELGDGGINISWNSTKNEISTNSIVCKEDSPCSVIKNTPSGFAPLCISFKPNQDEFVWKRSEVDKNNKPRNHSFVEQSIKGFMR